MANDIIHQIDKLDIPSEDAIRLSKILWEAASTLYGELGQEADFKACRAWSQTFNLYGRLIESQYVLTPAQEAEVVASVAQARQ